MKEISELTVLLRARSEMPAGLRLKNDEFEDGWNFVRTGSALQLEKKIKNRGWHFIRVSDGLLRSGIGGTPQEAIACGLKLALHHVSVFFNTVEIDRIGLTQYPWFFLARVSIHPCRIQLSSHPASEICEQC
jgi:hypothetical protein